MVDNRIHDILTAVKNVVIPRVELSIVSPNTTSVRGYRSEILNNPDNSDFTENMEESPLMNASNHLFLNNDNDETRVIRNDEDGDSQYQEKMKRYKRTLFALIFFQCTKSRFKKLLLFSSMVH